jgi:hypothetical protein
MAGQPKVDPAILVQEYITSDISYRTLAARHGIHYTTIAQRAAKEGWQAKRDAYRDSLLRHSYEETASRKGAEKAATYDLMYEAGRKYVEKFVSDLDSGTIKTSAKDFVSVANLLLSLMGEPTNRSETTIVEFDGRAAMDGGSLDNLEQFLRRVSGQPAGEPVIVEGTGRRLVGPLAGAESPE